MNKYEISLWEDYSELVSTASGIKSVLKERKIAVIGSDTMKAQARALEPNLVEEINGTNTFTFKMYYTYTDNQTGEKYSNPFAKYLVNERKVKVFWQNKWYDLVIKKCQEDSSKKSVTYICKDLFVNELSKQGYNLEFDTELQNNIGTAAELAKQVLDGSTWLYDDNASTAIIQKTEGPVYETNVISEFDAIKQSPLGDTSITIPFEKKILVFYDSLINILNLDEQTTIPVQFIYSEDGYQTDVNDTLVINGDCCVATLSFIKDGDNLTAISTDANPIITINLLEGVSKKYTAKRLIKSQRTEYDPLLDRYVSICSDTDNNKVYEIIATEYTNPLAVINLMANSHNFVNTAGWIGQVNNFIIFPKFDSETELSNYRGTAYLKINSGYTYNSAIQSNISYFTPNDTEKQQGKIGGIQKGEKFIFRLKAYTDYDGAPNIDNLIDNKEKIIPNLFLYNTSYEPQGKEIFNMSDTIETSDGWFEYTLIANKSISCNQLNQYGLFIKVVDPIWIENVQFFRYLEGATSYDENAQIQRMNPDEISLQSIAVPVYKYYYPASDIDDVKDLTFLYSGSVENNNYKPVYNNYEKIGTIHEKESNRFNILQSIAETFQAWVKFRIDHEEDGSIKIVNGVLQKYVYFVEELEHDNGLSFEYGIDLKAITRSVDSDKLSTKIIVNPNNNEFGKNGFCAIARSEENYCKENFILNLDYFVQQNLLDGAELKKDLYSVNDNNTGICYYYYLNLYNSEYDILTYELNEKAIELIRQTSQMKIYQQYLSAAYQQLETIQSDLINLAGVSSWEEVEGYAQSHANNEKVQSLLNSYAQVYSQINIYSNSYNQILKSINVLQGFIDNGLARQKELIQLAKEKHKEFNDKYTNYIMEGTWQSEDYNDDTKYYLDALKVAYTSSRPQLSYTINVLRLSNIEEFSSKIFNLGDICYIQDREFFGYLSDGITPYKEKILISKISSFFDSPEKDVLTVQNYKTRFDDLFQRITAASQNLEYAEGSYARAANSINTNGTINSAVLQNTFDENSNLVLNSSNQDVVWDDTGITVVDKFNSGNKTKILAGGIFVTNDGGITWKNAVRGDGISASLLTAGRINTNEIYIYDGNAPSFRWDSYGLTAYSRDDHGAVNFGRFVRFDKYGIYGYNNEEHEDFMPGSLEDVTNNASFSLTWAGLTINDNDAVISVGDDVLIEHTGIITSDLVIKNNLYFINGNNSTLTIPFNLTYGVNITNGDDLDNYITPNTYQWLGTTGLTNAPVEVPFKLIVMKTTQGENIDYIRQIVYPYNNSLEWVRYYVDNTWSTWACPITTLSLPLSISNGGTGATTAAAARTNLGAVNITGDTMSGNLEVVRSQEANIYVENTKSGQEHCISLCAGASGRGGIYDETFNKWLVYYDKNGNLGLGTALPIASGGTGAITTAAARANLSVPALISDTYPTLLASNESDGWIKIGKANTNYGLLPSQAGNPGSGHNYLGASSWYWKGAFIDEIYGTYKGNAIAIANGGTGATSAANARTNLGITPANIGAAAAPTVVVDNTTFTGETVSKNYTVSGNGVVIAFVGSYSDGSSDYGTFQADISYDGTVIMGEGTRWGSDLSYRLGASCSVPIAVTNGKKIELWVRNTKAGTKYLYRRFICFGCTVA